MIEFPTHVDFEIDKLSRSNTRGIDVNELKSINCSLSRLAKVLNIDIKDLEKKDNWYLYNEDYYYFKRRECITYILNELLGVYISGYMGLSTINYELALDDNKIVGLLSNNFCRKDKKYQRADSLNILYLCYLKYALSRYCHNKSLHEKLCKIIIKDYYSCMRDRKCNTLCETTFFNIDVAPLYDYERSFSLDFFSDEYYNPLFRLINLWGGYMQMINNDVIRDLLKKDEYFYSQMLKMMDFDMIRALDNIREKYKINIPDEIMTYYRTYDIDRKEELKQIIKKVG